MTFPARAAVAAEITYTVNPSESTLTLSGNAGVGSVSQQRPSAQSLLASYTGTITADRDLQAQTLQFTGGTIVAVNSGSYEAPITTPTPANYGFTAGEFAPAFALTNLYAAIRDFSFSLGSPVVSTSGGFNASQLSPTITSGEIDCALVTTSAEIPSANSEQDFSSPVAGDFTLASGAASVVDITGVETLTIPFSAIDSDYIPDTTNPINYFDFEFSGSIVATAVVPEPSSLALFAITSALLARPNGRLA